MCFSSSSPKPAPTPAPAPPAPEPAPMETEVGSARKAADESAYGSSTPSLRRDGSLTAGGIRTGAGLRTM